MKRRILQTSVIDEFLKNVDEYNYPWTFDEVELALLNEGYSLSDVKKIYRGPGNYPYIKMKDGSTHYLDQNIGYVYLNPTE